MKNMQEVKQVKYGAVLKECRTRKGLSQSELADILYINQSDVSKYENGSKEPSISLFVEWAKSTQAQEIIVAFICGMDGLSILQSLSTLIGTIFLGGIL